MKRNLLIGAVCFALAASALALTLDHYPGPDTLAELNAGCDVSDLVPRGITDEFYNESYYHNGIMSDGTVVYVQFIIHNIGLSSFYPSADLVIVTPDGKAHHATRNYDPEDLVITPGKFEVSFMGNVVEGDPRGTPPTYRIRAWFDQLGADLTYRCDTPAFIDRGIYYDKNPEKYQKWVTYCPKGEITGKLKVNGRQRQVRGRGFADHGASATISTGTAGGGFQIYQRGGNQEISVALMESRVLDHGKKLRTPDLLVAVGQKNVFFSRDDYVLDITGVGVADNGKQFPDAFHLEAGNEWFRLKGDFKMERFLIYAGIFDRLNPVFAATLNVLFQRPGYYRFLSRFDYTYTFNGETKTGSTYTVSQIIYAGEPDFSAWLKK